MREGWETKTLGELCEFRRGLTYKKADEVSESSNVVLRANNVDRDTGKLVFDELRYIRDDIEIPESKRIRRDTLLICTASGSKSHLGKVAIIDTDKDYAFGGFMGLLIPSELVLPRYLYWITQSDLYRDHLRQLSDGMNINNLKWKELAQLVVPLPPLAEQKRIVAILDKAFEAIERAEECHRDAITRADLFTGRFADQVLREVHTRSELRSLRDWGLRISTGPFGSLLHKSDYIEGGVPLINPVNLVNGEIEVDAVKTVADDALERLQRYRLNAGDVLVARRGEIGRCAPVSSEAAGWLCGTGCFVIRANSNADPRYLAWLVRAGPNHDMLVRASSRATMPSISNKDLAKLEIALPPLFEQRKIVERIDIAAEQARELRGVHERRLESLTALRQALLTQAFQGSLTRMQERIEVVA